MPKKKRDTAESVKTGKNGKEGWILYVRRKASAWTDKNHFSRFACRV